MRRVPALTVLFLLSVSTVLRAQSTNGALTGRVTDSSKAVIVDARVAATNADTNVRHEATTSASGEYYLPNLPPGRYRLEVEKDGFKKIVKPDVILPLTDALHLH